MPGIEDYSDYQLRQISDAVLVYRRHVPWGESLDRIVEEPVDLCLLDLIKFHLHRLRQDARDLRGVSFIYRFTISVPDEDLAAVRSHIKLEEEVHLALRCLERDFYTRE